MSTSRMSITVTFSFLIFSFISFAQSADTLPKWAFGGFVRPYNVNPIIAPGTATSFTDPVSGKSVSWESNDAFNPGATIKGGKIVILYCAEDESGAGIGEKTSCLGYAESADGLTITRLSKPVLYPAGDS